MLEPKNNLQTILDVRILAERRIFESLERAERLVTCEALLVRRCARGDASVVGLQYMYEAGAHDKHDPRGLQGTREGNKAFDPFKPLGKMTRAQSLVPSVITRVR
jgi:hypothetical protein